MKRKRKSTGTQFYYLVRREAKGVFRNKAALFARFGVTIAQSVLYALMFQGVGMDYSKNYSHDVTPQAFSGMIAQEFGALLCLLFMAMFGNSQPILL